MIIAFVLWHGYIGGAERFSISLAGEMSARGVETHIVFVNGEGQLQPHVAREGLTSTSIGFPRGALVLRHPRTLAKSVAATGADVAIVGSFGYLGAALRAGGFSGTIIGVEHGVLHQRTSRQKAERFVRWVDRASGLLGYDAEVAVSRYMEQLARQTIHARRLVCIKHGVRVSPVPSQPPIHTDGQLELAYAGRLTSGKGVDVLLYALAQLRRSH